MLILAALLTICAPGPRDNCVIDPDTFWLNGEKIRIAEIDGPELSQPKCPSERALAIRGRDRLQSLLNSGEVEIERRGVDRYGRTLGRVTVDGRDVGQRLIEEGLARPYAGGRKPWC